MSKPTVYVVGRVGKLEAFREPPKREEIRGAGGDLVYVRWSFERGAHRVGFVSKDGALDESAVSTLLIRQISERDAKILAEHDAEVERAREALAGITKERQNFMALAARRGDLVRVDDGGGITCKLCGNKGGHTTAQHKMTLPCDVCGASPRTYACDEEACEPKSP